MRFHVLWGVDVVITLIFVYFFLVGLQDGSVSSFNLGLWLAILAVLGAVLLGSYGLRSAGSAAMAEVVAAAVALPGLMYAFLILMAILLNPRWN